jgi:hypothetical protein
MKKSIELREKALILGALQAVGRFWRELLSDLPIWYARPPISVRDTEPTSTRPPRSSSVQRLRRS